ncbi:alpha/beta hydrolase [Desulfobotulus sp. H1]|uniref:Alpha/beta hydrolase n=1 Tax=Desulfobotulus pelophilus TaxID=2823377 RepID=A0ABT3NCV4_9BACT|nr:alpha/beta hydrolase [Desulfobotulus pelophilus]MCW7755287.1 alpha/beta hydrolase [Desulfobotulus pelophilus]
METKLCLIHGMWGSPALWHNYRFFFESNGYKVCCPALPHHIPPGETNKVAREGMASYLSSLEKQLIHDAADTILIGHSMGGLLAQILASRHPFKAIILITPAPPAEVSGLDFSSFFTFLPILFLGNFWQKALIPNRESFHRICGGRLSAETESDLFSSLVPESGKAFSEMAFPFLHSSKICSVPPHAIRCPIRIYSGGRDVVTPPSVVRRISRYYNTEQIHYPPLSHGMIWEPEWEDVARHILEWIRNLAAHSQRTS